jgi:predicted DNA-binding protein
MEKLQRTQILLEPSQHRSLYQLAQAEGRSMSELVREAVAQYLVDHESVADSQLEALAKLTRLREEIEQRHGILPAELIIGDRGEREEELWQRLTGEQ